MDGLAPALVNSEWVLGKPTCCLAFFCTDLPGPLQVAGQSWNLEMPPPGAALSDEQIAGVLTFIRREWDHNGSAITPDLVGKIRNENNTRTKSWTAEELKALIAPKKTTALEKAAAGPLLDPKAK
jgi:hypothetical protein